jgi:hypothetical protein
MTDMEFDELTEEQVAEADAVFTVIRDYARDLEHPLTYANGVFRITPEPQQHSLLSVWRWFHPPRA